MWTDVGAAPRWGEACRFNRKDADHATWSAQLMRQALASVATDRADHAS